MGTILQASLTAPLFHSEPVYPCRILAFKALKSILPTCHTHTHSGALWSLLGKVGRGLYTLHSQMTVSFLIIHCDSICGVEISSISCRRMHLQYISSVCDGVAVLKSCSCSQDLLQPAMNGSEAASQSMNDGRYRVH